MRRLALLCAVAALLAGCGGATPPEVTFVAGATSVVAKPTQYCDLKLQDCRSDANAPVRLAVPAGTALRVTVPEEISSTDRDAAERARRLRLGFDEDDNRRR